MKYYIREVAYQVTEPTNWGDRETNFGTSFYHRENTPAAKMAKEAAEKFVANQGEKAAWLNIRELERFVPAEKWPLAK